MKKISYILIVGVVALMISGCAKEVEGSLIETSYKKVSLVFKGGYATTKTAFGESDGSGRQLVWSTGDAIGIFSYEGSETTNDNIKANILASTVGEANGTFIPEEEITVVDSDTTVYTIEYPESSTETFLIYYPYDEDTILDELDDCIYGTLAKSQDQSALCDCLVGKNGFSYALSTVTASDQEVNFTLEHAMAYIRFQISTTELTDYQLHSIVLYDANEEAALSGRYIFDPSDCSLTPLYGDTYSYARVTIEDDDFTASTSDAQELYLTVFPEDLTSADMKVVVTYVKEDGSSVSVPMDLDLSLNLTASSLNTITLSGVSTSSIDCDWYEPYEDRNLVNGWAYGPQNTYYVTQLEAPEDYASFSDMNWSEVEVSVKGRGDFSQLKEPRYYAFVNPGAVNRNLIYLPDQTNSTQSTPTFEVSDDYTITLLVCDNRSNGNWSVVGLYDEDQNLIWTINFVSCQVDDPVSTVEYTSNGFTLMDRFLGQRHSFSYASDEDNGAANLNSDSNWTYFQWGRMVPVQYANGSRNYVKNTVDLYSSIKTAIADPLTVFCTASGVDDYGYTWDAEGDWQVADGNRDDLWGAVNESGSNYNTSLTGVKTIYDPCPEGYRVCDAAVLSLVRSSSEALEYGDSDNPFDLPVTRVNLGSGNYDYWPWMGGHQNDNTGYGKRVANVSNGLLVWCNSSSGTSHQSACLADVPSNSYLDTNATSAPRGYAFPIRCQVDEYGR